MRQHKESIIEYRVIVCFLETSVCRVDTIGFGIVISFDEKLVPTKLPHYLAEIFAVMLYAFDVLSLMRKEVNVTQMENSIVIMHDAVPSFDYPLIHFFHGIERSRTVINYLAMIEMCICDKENRHPNQFSKQQGWHDSHRKRRH